jgi:hypothetical protein
MIIKILEINTQTIYLMIIKRGIYYDSTVFLSEEGAFLPIFLREPQDNRQILQETAAAQNKDTGGKLIAHLYCSRSRSGFDRIFASLKFWPPGVDAAFFQLRRP